AFTAAEKAEAVNTLASKPAYAAALLDAVESGKVPRGDLSAFTVRQLMTLKDSALTQRVEKAFGAVRQTPQDKAGEINQLKSWLSADALKTADPRHGRLIFSKTCAPCHTLFDAGGNVGPNLTGSQ